MKTPYTRAALSLSLLFATSAVAEDAPAAQAVSTSAAPTVAATAAEPAPAGAQATGGPKRISGMSILGNQEAPKALVIVPWKSSEIGDAAGIDALLDDSRRPVDRDVFLRELAYYEIRSQ